MSLQSGSDVARSDVSEDFSSAAEDASLTMDDDLADEDPNNAGGFFSQAINTLFPREFQQQMTKVTDNFPISL